MNEYKQWPTETIILNGMRLKELKNQLLREMKQMDGYEWLKAANALQDAETTITALRNELKIRK
jgi:hypothetical protein